MQVEMSEAELSLVLEGLNTLSSIATGGFSAEMYSELELELGEDEEPVDDGDRAWLGAVDGLIDRLRRSR